MRFASTLILVTALLLGHYPTATLTQAPEVDGGDVFSDTNNNITESVNATAADDESGNGSNSNNNNTDPDVAIPVDNEGDSSVNSTANNDTQADDVDPFFPPTGPTAAPSAAPRVPVAGFITLELVDTPSVMDDERMALFVEISDAFLSFNVFFGSPTLTLPGDDSNTTYLLPLVSEEGLIVQMTRQSLSLLVDDDGSRRRQLQQSTLRPLYVTLQVTGMAREASGVSVQEDSDEPKELQDLDNLDFDFILQQIFIEKQEEYVEALQITGDPFFGAIEQVNVLLESTLGDIPTGENENEDAESPMDDASEPDRDSVGDNDNGGGNNSDGSVPAWIDTTTSSSEDTFFTTPVIIGIAVGGGVLLLACCFCVWYQFCFRKRNRQADGPAKGVVTSLSTSGGSVNKAPVTPKNKPWNRRRNKSAGGIHGPVDSMAEQHLMSTDNSSNRPDDEESDVASSADLESQAMYSYNPRGDSGSVYTASNSTMMAGGGGGGGGQSVTNHSYYGNDNMSYAYSLEAGIEASIVDGVLMNNTTMNQSTTFHEDSTRSRVPIREIPQIGGNGAPSTSVGMHSGSIANSRNSNNDAFGDTQIETAASDLKLTESELAMLPSNLRSDDDGDSPSIDADSRGFPAVSKKVITKVIQAPSGKLGIVIDTTVEGPVVHNVNEGSRLQGLIFPGDIIIAIDSVDTRAMSASAITALMVKTAAQERSLTVRRPAPSE